MSRRQSRWNRPRQIVGVSLAMALGSLPLGSGRAEAESLTGLTSTGTLVRFDSTTPGTIGSSVAITGLQAGETLLGIDRRPANGLLYGLGSTSRIYTINTTTGVATFVGATPFAPALTGTVFGFDFNPVPDRIRVVSTDTTNFRLNPNTGVLAGTNPPLKPTRRVSRRSGGNANRRGWRPGSPFGDGGRLTATAPSEVQA